MATASNYMDMARGRAIIARAEGFLGAEKINPQERKKAKQELQAKIDEDYAKGKVKILLDNEKRKIKAEESRLKREVKMGASRELSAGAAISTGGRVVGALQGIAKLRTGGVKRGLGEGPYGLSSGYGFGTAPHDFGGNFGGRGAPTMKKRLWGFDV